jgi:predicted acetyltransferase
MTDSVFGSPRGEKEEKELARILGQAFGQPPEKIMERFPQVGLGNMRVLRDGGTVGGGLWTVPMGQWFGGRSVPMTGIAAVGVAPEARGRGVARRLMNETIKDLHEQGVALSTLYPATQTLYRKSGYEQGGGRFLYTIAPKDIDLRGRSLPMREAREEDRDTVARTYAGQAADLDGHLDRGPYIWQRIYKFRDENTHGFLVEDGDDIAGYIYYFQKNRDDGGYDLAITDLVARTPAAARTLLGFLSDHRSMSPEASWFGGPTSSLFVMLPEQRYEMKLQMYWMTRVVSVRRALEARGYPPGLSTEVHLEIQDELIPENQGRLILEVSGGEGRVREGGDGHLSMDIRGLTPLYTGFLTPMNLCRADMLHGDPYALRRATGIFSGSTPSMSDMF